MMKVVLVYPPIIFGKKERLGLPPLGILYIATFLQKKGIDVKIIDSSIQGHTLNKLTKEILKKKPDIVGFSVMTCQIRSVLDVVKGLKKNDSSLKIAVGGPHVNATKEELFTFSKNIDFLFYGEAEIEFYNLVKALEKNDSLEKIKGLIHKKNKKTMINEPPILIKNLDELPFPNIGLINIKLYDIYYAKSLPLASLLTSRGCPFSCSYCSASLIHGKKLRLRSPQNVVDEIEYNNKNYQIKQFVIKDSTFTVNRERTLDICSEIQRRNLKIKWSCNTRADLIDEKLLVSMKKSGCHVIAFGIESGSQKILNILQKGLTIEQIKIGISLCKKVGIERIGTFMVGNPTETCDDAKKTVKFMKELKLDLAFFLSTIAYPGTVLYDWAIENKALPDRFWYAKKDGKIFANGWEVNGGLNLDNFLLEQRLRIIRQANVSFYLSPYFIIKQILKVKEFSDIKRNLKSLRKLL